MEELRCLHAVAAPLAMEMVDTDQIFPSRFMSRERRDGGFAQYFLHDLRFDSDGNIRRGFILNDLRLAGARILVAAGVYGVGSGRPGAVLSHLDYGIRVIIAESFGPVFSAVAYKSGLLTLPLGRTALSALRHEIETNLGTQVTVDLEAERIRSPGGVDAPFTIDPFVKRIIIQGLSEIDLTLKYAASIDEIERRQHSAMPWLSEPTQADKAQG